MRAAGGVVSRDELMTRLCQRKATPFDRSPDVHISHLRRKLEYDVIRTVRRMGYQFTVEEHPPKRHDRLALGGRVT